MDPPIMGHPPQPSPIRFHPITMGLHWGVAIAVLGLVAWGWWMTELGSPVEKLWAYGLHKSIGILVWVAMIIRLAARAVIPRPPPVAAPRWRRFAAISVHSALYCCLLGMPLLGWVNASAANFPVNVFGVVTLPRITPTDPELAALAIRGHLAMSWVLVALVVVHAGAALRHHFVDRDRTLMRMLPFGGGRSG